MKAAFLLAPLLAAACASAGPPAAVEAARKLDVDAVRDASAEIDAMAPSKFVVVQFGRVAAAATLPDDAVRAAERADSTAPHRFVFRPADRGPRTYRLAYVSEGGIVVGRRFLADLGIEASVVPGKPARLRRRGATVWLDLARTPRLEVLVSALDGSRSATLAAAFDPDFDGGLLLPRDAAARLTLERFEIPGDAEVQVALGRPFTARRATVLARCDALQASAPAEAVFETPPSRR